MQSSKPHQLTIIKRQKVQSLIKQINLPTRKLTTSLKSKKHMTRLFKILDKLVTLSQVQILIRYPIQRKISNNMGWWLSNLLKTLSPYSKSGMPISKAILLLKLHKFKATLFKNLNLPMVHFLWPVRMVKFAEKLICNKLLYKLIQFGPMP
jgi:hypothetical protein